MMDILYPRYIIVLVQIAQFYVITRSHFVEDNNHEVVYPYIRFTNHETFESRNRRDVNNVETAVNNDNNEDRTKLDISFKALGKEFRASLHLNKRLLAPNFKVEILGENGQIKNIHGVKHCYYSGKLENDSNSLISLSHCNGLEGVIQTKTEKFSLKPFHHEDGIDGLPLSMQSRPYIVRKMTVDNYKNDAEEPFVSNYYQQYNRTKRSIEDSDSSCGLDGLKPYIRWSRGIMSEKIGDQTIETMLTVDKRTAQYYGMDAAKQYALTVANVAHDILRDSTIGPNPVNLVISKLVILTAPLDDLVINHHARNSLASFGKWSEKRNNINEAHPDHYDYSILLTRHDICVDRNQPCETKGLSYVGGMCDGIRSSAIIEDGGFGSAFTLAHQIGHSLGMDHDGIGNTCIYSDRIMSTNGGKAQGAYHWSPCSIDYLQQFLRKDQSKCLDNDAPKSKREDIAVYENPGYLYDADTQCRYAIGDHGKACYEDDSDEVCVELLCFNPLYNNCTRIGKPAMDGTPCGPDKWCKEAICVQRGQRDDLIIDGGWNEWSNFQQCSRTCGGGISYRERICETPKPKHGGKFCEGQSRMYVVCNKEPCLIGAESFRRSQCKNQSLSFYEDHLLNWTYNGIEPESSCELQCHSSNSSDINKYFGHAKDGTDCQVGNLPGRCIRGECNTVGCDMLLGSTQRPDRCGVCGGNGATCTNTIDLNKNPLSISRAINNADIVGKIAFLEEKRTHHMEDVAKKLVELRKVMKEVVARKCLDDQECMGHFDISGLTKKGNVEAIPGKFHWMTTFSGCSVSCGRGTEYLQAECRRVDDATPVANKFCNHQKRPVTVARACEKTPCPPSWTTSKWTSCTRSCGGGRKIRHAYCTLNIGNEEYILPGTQCNAKEKPKRLALCNLGTCPAEWFAEPYGQCSTTCDHGVRTRSVVCRKIDEEAGTATIVSDEECSHSPIPETKMICNAHNPCPGGQCGNVWHEERGNITSPSYPQNYLENTECVHEISGKPNTMIILKFNDVDIAAPQQQFNAARCAGDFLRITDGKCSDVGLRSSVKLCGKQVPGYYKSTGSNVCIKFVSDQSLNGKGFSLSYKMTDKPHINQAIRDICDMKGEQVNSTLGIITSPNYPHNYPINEDCKATFMSPDGTGFMLKFDAFQIGTRSGIMDCKNDYLEVYYDDKAQRICGKEPSIPTIHIPSTTFTMAFHSSHVQLDNKGFVLTYVTKRYAKQYAVDKKTANNLQDYSETLSDWQAQQRPTSSSTTDEYKGTIERASTIKKSGIDRLVDDGLVRNKEELVQILLELAEVTPKRLEDAFGKRNKLEHVEPLFEHGFYKLTRPVHLHDALHPSYERHSFQLIRNQPHQNIRKSYIPSPLRDNDQSNAKLHSLLDKPEFKSLTSQETKNLDTDLALLGMNLEGAFVTPDELPYAMSSNRYNEKRTFYPAKVVSTQHQDDIAKNYKRTNVWRGQNLSHGKGITSSSGLETQVQSSAYQGRDVSFSQFPTKQPGDNLLHQPYKQAWRNSLPGGTLPLSKLTPTLLNKAQSKKNVLTSTANKNTRYTSPKFRISYKDIYSFIKDRTKGAQKNRKDTVPKTHTVELNHLNDEHLKNLKSSFLKHSAEEKLKPTLIEPPVQYETGNVESRIEKAFIPAPPSVESPLTKPTFTKKSEIVRPVLSNYYNYAYNTQWQSPETNNAQVYVRSQFPQQPTFASAYQQPRINWMQSQIQQQPTAMYKQPYQPSYWKDSVKRQYQSFPFMYVPHFGVFKNQCPPKSSFSCRDIIFHPICTTDNDCLDLRLGCCETDCNYAQQVCLPKNDLNMT